MSITKAMCDDRHKNLWALLMAMMALAAIAVPIIGWVVLGFRSLEVSMEKLEVQTATQIETAKTEADAAVRAAEIKALNAAERAQTRALKTERALEVQIAHTTEFRAKIDEKLGTMNAWMKTISTEQKELTRAVDRMATIQERQLQPAPKPSGPVTSNGAKRGPT